MGSMTHPVRDVDHVIGVDTHKHTHTAVLVEVRTGQVSDEIEITTDQDGYQQLLDWAPDTARVWAIEGAGSFGSGLTRRLVALDETVFEVERPRRPAPKHGGKSDRIDAARAAREVLARQHQANPKQHGPRAAIAMHLAARNSAIDAYRVAQHQLLAFVLTAPPVINERLRGLRTDRVVAICSRMRGPADPDVETAHAVTVMKGLAKRVLTLKAEAENHRRILRRLVADWRPDLLELVGVGPIVSATVLTAWSHPGRIRSEAAFAQLAGVAPLPASSGTTTRHRLSRDGDRQLNRALHTVALSRSRVDPDTRDYIDRRSAAGRTSREIQRCLKRYIARQLFRQLENPPPQPT